MFLYPYLHTRCRLQLCHSTFSYMLLYQAALRIHCSIPLYCTSPKLFPYQLVFGSDPVLNHCIADLIHSITHHSIFTADARLIDPCLDNQYLQCTIFTTSRKFPVICVIGRSPSQPIDMIDVCGSVADKHKNNTVKSWMSYRVPRDTSKSQPEGSVGVLE